MSPPAIKILGNLGVEKEAFVTFYMKSSTVGNRGVVMTTKYQVKDEGVDFNCQLTDNLNLETMEPFHITNELLRLAKFNYLCFGFFLL